MTVEQRGVLDERYVLDEEIGRGGMADVFRATDTTLHRQVAVKILRESTESSNRGRFVDEARTLASLNHPALITLLDAGFQGDRPFLVMELVRGETLSRRLGTLPAARIAEIGAAVAGGLAYAHGQGVVHRDVKPGNILLSEDGRVLLADFGIARLVGSTEGHTRVGETIGSPGWIAPEQVAGEPITPAIDVYSLGLVLLEALTGERAYRGTPVETAVARLTAPPSIPEHVDPRWQRLLTRMTAREPAGRPSAEEVADVLTAITEPADATRVLHLPSEPTTTPVDLPADAGRPRTPWHRVDQRLVLGGVALLGLVLLIALILARPDGRANPTPAPDPLPPGIPGQLQQPLQDLHDAVEGTP